MPNSGLILVTDIKIDTNRRQVFKSDERIRLTGMEFSLLELLVSRSGEPFSRGEILKKFGDIPRETCRYKSSGCSYIKIKIKT